LAEQIEEAARAFPHTMFVIARCAVHGLAGSGGWFDLSRAADTAMRQRAR
jgi:hypothetical protein